MDKDQFGLNQGTDFGLVDVNEYVDTTVDMSAGLSDAIYSSVDTSVDTTVDMSSSVDASVYSSVDTNAGTEFAFHNSSFNPYEGLLGSSQVPNATASTGNQTNWYPNGQNAQMQMNYSNGQPQMNGTYGQSQMNGTYGQPQMNGTYGQPQMNGTYGQSQMNSTYGQPQMNGAYGQPQMNGAYGQPQMNGTYGQSQMNGTYGQSQMNGTYGQSQMNGTYGQPQNQNAYSWPPVNQYGGNNYNNPYGNNSYATPGKKVDTGVLVACIIGGVILLIVIILAIIVKITSSSSASNDRNRTYGYESNDDDWYSDEWDDYDFDDDDDNYVYETDGYSSVYDSIDWDDTSWSDDLTNYDPEDTWDSTHTFYENLKHCVDEDLSYSFTHETYEYLDEDKGVCVRVNYYQIEGDDVLNKDAINTALYDCAMKSASKVDDNLDFYKSTFDTYGYGYTVYVDSYITYCDESMFSMVSSITTHSAAFNELYLNCVNVNMDLGMVLDNSEIIQPSSEFTQAFSDALADQDLSKYELTDDEIEDLMNNEDALILYFSPCGLEFGENYTDGYSYGWFTATVVDYEGFFKSN